MEILFKDENIIVCIKPIGVDSENQMPQLICEEIKITPFAVHRLDLNVGGVMVYALNKKSAAMLSQLIANGEMVKEYVATVHGVTDEKGDWEDLLWKDSKKNKVYVVNRMRGGVKKARLEFERIWTDGNSSIVHIRLHTGRSHQIRVQFASRKFPLVGDHKYGSRDEAKEPKLFSCRLTFPYKNKVATFEAFPSWFVEAEKA